MEETLLTLAEAAKRLHLTRNALYYWRKQGKLSFTWDTYHARRLVLAEQVEALRQHLGIEGQQPA